MKKILCILVPVLILCSCVPNRKVVFLQKDDVHQKDMPRDSILRVYEIEPFHYKVQTNDVLSIRFQSLTPEEFDFFGKTNAQPGAALATGALLFGDLVDDNGEVFFPVVGKVKVAGMTVFEIQDKLQVLATQYLESPTVKVRLMNFRVTVLGEVLREGTVSIANNRVTTLEVLALSGGMTDLADRSKIKLIRQYGDSTEVQYVNVLDENFMTSPYYYAHQNDILVIPPLRQRAFRKYFGTNLALVLSTFSIVLFTINQLK